MERVSKIVAVIALLLAQTVMAGGDLSTGIVRIAVTRQQFNYAAPWRTEAPETHRITGCVVNENTIITVADPIAHGIVFAVTKPGDPLSVFTDIAVSDNYSGLAFLSLPDNSFFKDINSIELAESGIPPGDKYLLVWNEDGDMEAVPVSHEKTVFVALETVGGALMHIMGIDIENGTDLIGGLIQGGEPVVVDGALMGIVHSVDTMQRIRVIAVDVINKSLKDYADGEHKGYPFFSIYHAPLNRDVSLRQYLGVHQQTNGVLVIHVPSRTSGHGTLEAGDVILSIEGQRLDDFGLYETGLYGKMPFQNLISLNHHVGDQIELDVLRGKKRMEISFSLIAVTERSFLIPPPAVYQRLRYIVVGGAVFQELNTGYMRAQWGNDWRRTADPRLLYYYNNYWLDPSLKKERIVILSHVLPDSLNIGYHDKANLILLKVNGIAIHDLEHASSIIEQSEDEFYVFEFQGDERIVFEKKMVDENQDRIFKTYGIPAPSFLGEDEGDAD